MLTADIHFSDLHAPVDIIDGRILFGASHITPFPHRLLRAVVVDTDDAVTVACLERFRDDPDGLDYLRRGHRVAVLSSGGRRRAGSGSGLGSK